MKESANPDKSKGPRGFSGLQASRSKIGDDPKASPDAGQAEATFGSAPNTGEVGVGRPESTSQVVPPKPADSAISPTAWAVVGVCVFVGVLALLSNSRRPAMEPVRAIEQSASAVEKVPEFAPLLAVAAINANLRSEANSRSKVLGQASRGTALEKIGEVAGFINVKLSDGRQGWIARELTIDGADVTRLNPMTARLYVEARKPLRGLETVGELLSPYRTMLERALLEVAEGSPHLEQTLTEISGTVHVSVPADSAGAIWFGLEAKSYADKSMLTEALESATAAVFADPAGVDGQVAFAFAAIKVGDYASVKAIASILPLLAPVATNTWVIVGVSAASENAQDLARNAFITALRKSRSPKVTEKFLNEVAVRSTDAQMSAAIGAALERWKSSRQ